MRPDELAVELEFLISRSPALPGRLSGAILIANPRAGGFTRPSYARRRHTELASLRGRAAALPPRPDAVPLELRLTADPGHAAQLARDWFASPRTGPAGAAGAPRGPDGTFRLLVVAAGDGTSLEALGALMELPPSERARCLVLRLPFGTGNDGSEGRDLLVALGRLLGPCAPAPRPAILCSPAPAGGKAPLWAFNIASLGADAFIADMTNRLKTSFPGDSYKLWVDIASVMYDFAWPSRPMRIRAEGGAGARELEGEFLLAAVGASGRRQYGSDKRILPGDENVCLLRQISLLRRLALKGPISAGRHALFPEVELFGASRLEFSHPGPLLFQADGEVTRLESADFPLLMELLPDSYNVLEGLAGSPSPAPA